MPRNVTGIVLGKSTYARVGIVTNFTPLEACYSPDTEVLSKEGWLPIGAIMAKDEVFTLNPETQIAEWQPVQQTHMHYHKGEMIHFCGRHIDLLVTPNHNVYVDKRMGRTKWKGWHLQEARKIYNKYNHSMSRAVNWVGQNVDTITFGDNKSYDAEKFAYFLGVYLGDGWVIIDRENGNYVIRLGAKKERKVKTHKNAIKEMGFAPYINKDHSIQFHNKEIAFYLAELGHSKSKYIPENIKNWSPRLLEILIKGMLDSDGNEETNTFYTSSKKLADDFQEIVFKIGKAAIVRERENEPTDLVPNANGNRYVVRATRNRVHKMVPSTHNLIQYDNPVFCIGVPNHIIFVRRNGKPVWSGNSWEGLITIEISNTTPLPARIYANEGIAQVLFFEGEPCRVSYNERKGGGKYQGQIGITTARIEPVYKGEKVA
jgi:hypothetical protein